MPAPRTETIRDVELVKVGTWAASTGVTKVTREDLEAMLAAHADGLVDRGPVKLGHESALNDQLGDGTPAYGWVVPTRVAPDTNGVDTLYGDLVGMPAQLAAIAPTAYRRRSVEIAWNVRTAAGKVYAAVLTGVALLGSTPPAVKGLADLVALYSEQPESIGRTDTVELVDGLEDDPRAVAMLAAAREAGATVDQLDAIASAAGARDTADVPPPTTDPVNDDTHDDPATRAGDETTDTGGHTMTDEELRAALNLEADADVNAELARILEERSGDPETAETDPTAEVEETPEAEVTEEAGELVGASSLSGADVLEFSRLAQESRDRRRNDALDTAIREGRILPAERASFAALMDKDETATISLLGAMAPRFSTTELGDDTAAATNLSEAQAASFDDFERATFGLDR